MKSIFQEVIFSLGNHQFKVGQILLFAVSLLAIYLLYYLLIKKILPYFYEWNNSDKKTIKQVNSSLIFLMITLSMVALLITLEFDAFLFEFNNANFKISTILQAIMIIQIARMLVIALSTIFVREIESADTDRGYEYKKPSNTSNSYASKTVQYIIYVGAIIYILGVTNFDFVLPFGTSLEGYEFRISRIFGAILIILFARLIIWIIVQLILYGYYESQKVNVGSQFAINQLISYVVYVIAGIMALEYLGIQMTVIWGGAAALLVGIGLGLQNTFNDLVSGIILLFERAIEVGDVVEVNGLVGTIQKIGIRTSRILGRDNLTVIVPNSKLSADAVINWSHYDNKARFNISIGVAYGSDTKKIKSILIGIAKENIYILKRPESFVRFVEFADSSLNLELHFWTKNFLIIEDIKSDLRFSIDEAFRENNIEIPFPQRVVYSK